MPATHSSTWQLHEAKDHLSEMIHAVKERGPQTITRHGVPVVVMVPVGLGAADDASPSAWDLLRDDLVADLGGPPPLPARVPDASPATDLP